MMRGSSLRLSLFDPRQYMTKRVIDTLRDAYPGKWSYSHEDHSWTHESGVSVGVYAALAPRYDGDDDTFARQYRWSDTKELVEAIHFPMSDNKRTLK